MSSIAIRNLLLGATTDFGLSLFVIVASVLVIGISMLIIKVGIKAVWHADGTTNWLGSHWSWYDQKTYSPWRGYKRYRSRPWNMEHTA